MSALILFLLIVPYAVADEPEFIQRLLGTTNLQIGFGSDCYLTWYEKHWIKRNQHEKPTEFRCGTRSGTEIEIVPEGNDRYLFKSGTKYMYWDGQRGDVKPMQFREETPDKKGDVFWIREASDGKFAIGYGFGRTLCPLYWKRGSEGDTKFDAEFHCNKPIQDEFWIKGADCRAISIRPVGNENEARYDGEEIVGHATGSTCSKTNYATVTIGHTDEVTEEISIELSESDEVNWETSASISLTAEAGFLGSGVETTLSVGFSHGGAKTFSSSETKSTGISNSKSSSSSNNFDTPGAAMVIGFVKRYIFDHSNVPATVTAECKNGHQYTFDKTIRLKSKVFGSTNYEFEAVEFKPGQCREEYFECLRATNFNSFLAVTNAKKEFKRCFPPESIKPPSETKKKRKVRKEKSSSKSENKDSSKSTDKIL